MCFLLIHFQTRERHPLVLLANRDEDFDRPFEPPALRDEEHGIVAPLDVRGGGTWLGTNARGLVAAITNRRGSDGPSDLPSRGGLVMEALRCRGALAAGDAIQRRLAQEPYAGFNLLLSDGLDAIVIRHDPSDDGKPRIGAVIELTPGAHVLTNLHELDEVLVPLEGLPDLDESIEATIRRLEALAENDQLVLPGDHRILRRGETRGTVCSAVIATTLDPAEPTLFRFANGVPGDAPFATVRGSRREQSSL